jgi:transposase InsO family protein
MKHVGNQTRIGTVVPGLASIRNTTTLTKAAKQRLAWIDYCQTHGHNARLTCRHYGIAHRTFYRYLNRVKLEGLRGLESRAHRPRRVRQPLTPLPVVDAIRSLRKANPEFSKYKLAVILKRDYGYSVSASTIGRIMQRYRLYFSPPVRPKSHPYRRTSIQRLRKPSNLMPSKPGDLIEVDVKHLPHLGSKHYGYVAIDVVSKQACVHVSSTITAKQGSIAWQKAVHQLGLPKAVLTDNGSENLGAFYQLLQNQQLPQYFARPRTPKDKPHVERFIGTLEKEFIQWGGVAIDLKDQQSMVDQWLHKYHSYRPHQSLGYLTPDEYVAKLRTEEVALM